MMMIMMMIMFFYSDVKVWPIIGGIALVVLLTTATLLTTSVSKELLLGLNVRHHTFVPNKG